MPAAALALVLLAGLIHALWNLAAKKAGGDARFNLLVCLLVAVVWAPPALWLARDVVPHWGWGHWGVIVASGLIHWVYFQCLLTGYRRSDLTVVYPVARGSGPLLSSAAAVALFGERLSALGAAGIAGVALGVFFIAGGPGLWRAAHHSAQRQRVRSGLHWGVLTGACIAAYTVFDAWVVKTLLISPLVYEYFSYLLRIPYGVPLALKNWPETRQLWRAQWRYALVVAVGGVTAYVMVLYAMQQAPISHVAPAREVSMLFAALIGGKLLGEADRGLRLLGAALIALGVVALGLGLG